LQHECREADVNERCPAQYSMTPRRCRRIGSLDCPGHDDPGTGAGRPPRPSSPVPEHRALDYNRVGRSRPMIPLEIP
jgi:hypothetical protein